MNEGWVFILLFILVGVIIAIVIADLLSMFTWRSVLIRWWHRQTRRLQRWQPAPQKPRYFYAFGSDEDKQWISIAFKRRECPDCGNKTFYCGPTGGGCQNIQCTSCGQAWNDCGVAVFRNPFNQFNYPAVSCLNCSASGEVSGDMHGQHYHCRICYGHGMILVVNPSSPPPPVLGCRCGHLREEHHLKVAGPGGGIWGQCLICGCDNYRCNRSAESKNTTPASPPSTEYPGHRRIRLRKEKP